jgi:hypothetical protein
MPTEPEAYFEDEVIPEKSPVKTSRQRQEYESRKVGSVRNPVDTRANQLDSAAMSSALEPLAPSQALGSNFKIPSVPASSKTHNKELNNLVVNEGVAGKNGAGRSNNRLGRGTAALRTK